MLLPKSPQETVKAILGAARLRAMGYTSLANAVTRWALKLPDAEEVLRKEILAIGREKWEKLRQQLRETPFAG